MCLAVPMKVTEVSEYGIARCRVGEGDTFVNASIDLLPEAPNPGDYVIVHAGFALRILEAADAEETLKILRQMAELGEQVSWGEERG